LLYGVERLLFVGIDHFGGEVVQARGPPFAFLTRQVGQVV